MKVLIADDSKAMRMIVLRTLRQSGLQIDEVFEAEDGAEALAAVPTFATRWLVPRLPALAAAHPGIVVHIETRTRPFLFADTGFDAALYAGTPEQVANWAGTRSLRLLHEALVPVCAPPLLRRGHALSAGDLADMPLLQQSTRPLAWQQWFDSAGVSAPLALAGPRYEVFSMTAAAAIAGMGVALMPRLLVEEELAQAFGPGTRFIDGAAGIARRIAHLTQAQAFERKAPDLALFTRDGAELAALGPSLARYGLEGSAVF